MRAISIGYMYDSRARAISCGNCYYFAHRSIQRIVLKRRNLEVREDRRALPDDIDSPQVPAHLQPGLLSEGSLQLPLLLPLGVLFLQKRVRHMSERRTDWKPTLTRGAIQNRLLGISRTSHTA